VNVYCDSLCIIIKDIKNDNIPISKEQEQQIVVAFINDIDFISDREDY